MICMLAYLSFLDMDINCTSRLFFVRRFFPPSMNVYGVTFREWHVIRVDYILDVLNYHDIYCL